MSQFQAQHLACPCGKSSDAYSIYESGVGKCFSCGKTFAPDGGEARTTEKTGKSSPPLLTDLDFIPLGKRGLSQETCKKYGYGIATVDGVKVQVAPYHDTKGRLVAQKVRFPDKSFQIRGSMKGAGLFGQPLVRSGGRMIVITEGEIDALSVNQALGGTWPVVSVPNGAQSAAGAIRSQLDLLEQYERVILCLSLIHI